jgi:enoyl-[acyl-carrier-protein] reductase (NADH)
VIVPGVGVVAFAEDTELAELTRAHFQQTMRVIRAAAAAGGYTSLTDAQAFADEYWPLMRYKPQLQASRGALCGRVALVSGAASTVGQAITDHLIALGAHVVLGDTDLQIADLLASRFVETYGKGYALGGLLLANDREAIQRLLRQATLAYGGVDILVHAGEGDDDIGVESLTSASLELLRSSSRSSIVVAQAISARRTAAMTREARRHGVRIHSVTVDTATADEVARSVAFLVSDYSMPSITIQHKKAVR